MKTRMFTVTAALISLAVAAGCGGDEEVKKAEKKAKKVQKKAKKAARQAKQASKAAKAAGNQAAKAT